MSDDEQFVERRQARANTIQVSGTTFGIFASFLVLAIGGLVRVIWDQHSAATLRDSQIRYLVEQVERTARDSRESSARNEARISSLERSEREHNTRAERIIGEWSFQLKNHERRINQCEKKCEGVDILNTGKPRK